MSRRTYGLLSIAQRHPRMFAAMHHKVEAARVVRGEPYTWANVPMRTDRLPRPAAERRSGPRASRWGDLV